MKPGRSGSLATSMEFRSSSLDAWHLSRTNGLPAGLKIAPTSRRSARSDQLRRLIPGVAQRVQPAPRALRIPGHAQRPPMQNDLVREENPLLPGNDLHQVPLDLHRVAVLCEIEARRNALDVRIHHYAYGNPVCCPQHHVGGLAR